MPLFIYYKASAGCRAHAAAPVHLRLHGYPLLGSGDPSPWIGAVPLALHLDPAWPAVLWPVSTAAHSTHRFSAELACSVRVPCFPQDWRATRSSVLVGCRAEIPRPGPGITTRCPGVSQRPTLAAALLPHSVPLRSGPTGQGHAVSAWHWLLWAGVPTPVLLVPAGPPPPCEGARGTCCPDIAWFTACPDARGLCLAPLAGALVPAGRGQK